MKAVVTQFALLLGLAAGCQSTRHVSTPPAVEASEPGTIAGPLAWYEVDQSSERLLRVGSVMIRVARMDPDDPRHVEAKFRAARSSAWLDADTFVCERADDGCVIGAFDSAYESCEITSVVLDARSGTSCLLISRKQGRGTGATTRRFDFVRVDSPPGALRSIGSIDVQGRYAARNADGSVDPTAVWSRVVQFRRTAGGCLQVEGALEPFVAPAGVAVDAELRVPLRIWRYDAVKDTLEELSAEKPLTDNQSRRRMLREACRHRQYRIAIELQGQPKVDANGNTWPSEWAGHYVGGTPTSRVTIDVAPQNGVVCSSMGCFGEQRLAEGEVVSTFDEDEDGRTDGIEVAWRSQMEDEPPRDERFYFVAWATADGAAPRHYLVPLSQMPDVVNAFDNGVLRESRLEWLARLEDGRWSPYAGAVSGEVRGTPTLPAQWAARLSRSE